MRGYTLKIGSTAFIVGVGVAATTEYVNGDMAYTGQEWPLFLGLNIVAVTWTVLHAWEDSLVVIRGFHVKRFVLRLLVAAGLSILMGKGLNERALATLLYLAAMFGVVFDPWYNHFKGNDFLYRGTEAWFDRIGINDTVFYIIKVATYLLATYTLIGMVEWG